IATIYLRCVTNTEIVDFYSSACHKVLTGYRDEVLYFFWFKVLFDDVSWLWDQIHSPATDATSAAATVEPETNMPDLDTSAPGSGPVKDQVREAFAAYGWDTGAQWDAVEYIVGKGSSWKPKIVDPDSGVFRHV